MRRRGWGDARGGRRRTARWSTSTGWAAARRRCSPRAGGKVRASPSSGRSHRGRAAGRGAQARRRADRCPTPTSSRAGSTPSWPRSSPSCASGTRAWTARLGPQPATTCASACAASPSRITGGHVIHMRQDPVPWAYRVFWRQVGHRPRHRPHAGRAARARPAQARRAAQPQPARRRDHDRHAGDRRAGDGVRRRPGGTRDRAAADRRRRAAGRLRARRSQSRQIVVADEDRALAVLSGEVAEERGVTPDDRRMVLASHPGEGRARDQRRGGPVDGGRDARVEG